MQFTTLVTLFFATFAFATPVEVETDVELETTGGARKEQVFPTDIFGYEDPEDFIQAYYEYKKGCTNDCEAGFVRQLVHNLV